RELHIIVNCTDRKRVPIPDRLQLRRVRGNSPLARVGLWITRLASYTGESLEASDLYAGDHWTVAKSLVGQARGVGFRTELWISSAGYGLVSSRARLHPYSATFAAHHPDTVVRPRKTAEERREDLRTWWQGLARSSIVGIPGPRCVADLFKASPRAYFLL